MSRVGPGLLLRELTRKPEPELRHTIQVIDRIAPDILILTDFDYDHDHLALRAFSSRLHKPYAHLFARLPNTGVDSGRDLDGNGQLGEPRDAQGYGKFRGQGSIAVLSLFPIVQPEVQDFSSLLWRDLPGTLMQPSDTGYDVQRLSSVAHWVVPIQLSPQGNLDLAVFAATPPIFDGPDDRNGRRNHDETALWLHWLSGRIGTPPSSHFAITGLANADPLDGEGRKSAIQALLDHDLIQDPQPMSRGARAAANPEHKGNPALDTADWRDPRPGNLRVSYVLPSKSLSVVNSGVDWPIDDETQLATKANRHKLVWVDIALPVGSRP